jgi:hypothetical protein
MTTITTSAVAQPLTALELLAEEHPVDDVPSDVLASVTRLGDGQTNKDD